MSSMRVRVSKLEKQHGDALPVDAPNKPIREWTDEELHAVIEQGDPEFVERLKSMTDQELLDLLEREAQKHPNP